MLLILPLLLLTLLWGGSLTQNWRAKLELPQSVTVQEGLCVHVPCKFAYSGTSYRNLYIFWFQKEKTLPVATNKPGHKLQEGIQGRFLLLGNLQDNDCSLSIRDAKMVDNGMYFFRMENYFSRHLDGDKMFTLKVTALNQSLNIQVPGMLKSGRPENFICSVPWACEQGTPPIFSWNSASHTFFGSMSLFSSKITLSPRPQDNGTNLTCQVTFPAVGVTMKQTVQLNVFYAPENMIMRVFQRNSTVPMILGNASSLTILEGQSLRVVCVADSNPPAELSWFQKSPRLNVSLISKTGSMELPQERSEEGVFICQAQNRLGSQLVLLNVSVHPCKPEPKSDSLILETVKGAAWGAGIMALLCLCLFLIFRLKTQRKKAARTVEGMNNTNLLLGSRSWDHHHRQFQIGVPSDCQASAQELCYVYLNFNELKLQEEKDTTTEYSEIKTHK